VVGWVTSPVSNTVLSCLGFIDNPWYFFIHSYVTGTLIHSLLGFAALVEQIFSGGHDTILLQHASFQPHMICTLMLVKQWLKLSQVIN